MHTFFFGNRGARCSENTGYKDFKEVCYAINTEVFEKDKKEAPGANTSKVIGDPHKCNRGNI